MFKAQSNNLVKEIKSKEKLEDRLKADHDQMEKMKSELDATKNNFKKAEINIDKLNETLKDIRVIENAEILHVYKQYWLVNFILQVTNNNLNTKNTFYDKQIKKLSRESKIKTELRAESVKEINRLQHKMNVCDYKIS